MLKHIIANVLKICSIKPSTVKHVKYIEVKGFFFCSLFRCPFQGGYSNEDPNCCRSSIVDTRYPAALPGSILLKSILERYRSDTNPVGPITVQ